jgi:hypothetical protein
MAKYGCGSTRFALKTEQFHIPLSTLNQKIKLLNIEIRGAAESKAEGQVSIAKSDSPFTG